MMTPPISTTVVARNTVEPDLNQLGSFRHVPYSDANRRLWSELIRVRQSFNECFGHETVRLGLEIFKIKPESMPNLEEVYQTLLDRTGWQIIEVTGALDDARLQQLAARKIRPVNLCIRADIENTVQWPDLIHDLFHLLPLLDPMYSKFTVALANAYNSVLARGSSDLLVQIKNTIWHLQEYGLVRVGNHYRAYGPILNEDSEGQWLVSNPSLIRLATVEEIAGSPWPWDINPYHRIGEPMDVYFAVAGFRDLYENFMTWIAKHEVILNGEIDDRCDGSPVGLCPDTRLERRGEPSLT